ncbi:hypothetical protein VTO42DRAFT_2392 [Malbranchea cinnamomea]
MHPDPHRVTHDVQTSAAVLDPPSSSQDGFLRDDCRASPGLRSQYGSDDGSVADANGVTTVTVELNPEPFTPPGQRVAEYEKAAQVSTSRARGTLGFKVIFAPGSANGGLTIDKFPNEVLTHILSYLPSQDLSAMSLVNRRFHSLVTTPHAWRIAFSRYFVGPASLKLRDGFAPDSDEFDRVLLQRRHFCRLTALASWRNEYILRTRLLRSLTRGRPAEVPLSSSSSSGTRAGGAGPVYNPNPIFTFGSLLLYPVTHVDARFGSGAEKKLPSFIHGASEQGCASTSEPLVGKVGAGSWGISDPQTFNHFADHFPFVAPWGLGEGEVVGVPNVMDVSQQFGMVYGEGCPPQGRTYFLPANEKRGRFLSSGDTGPQRPLGIPRLNHLPSCVCSVWIAKSPRVLEATNGLVGILSGSSLGVLTAYALGPHPSYAKRFARGQVTAKWVLCPGVPIISIKVDEHVSAKRLSQRRIWAVVLNALGEVFYLTDIPTQPESNAGASPEELDQLAWATGRSVRWELVESTRRVAQPDPHNMLSVDGSYSPRSSSASMGLTPDQVAAETMEIERFLALSAGHFRNACQGWDMRRKLEVDFAGDDGNGAGESVIVIDCGTEEGAVASVRRFTRLKQITRLPRGQTEPFPLIQPVARSIFGGPSSTIPSTPSEPLSSRSPVAVGDAQPIHTDVEWRVSDLVFNAAKIAQITASTIDTSTFAQLTMSEDALLTGCGSSDASSSSSSRVSSPTPWHGSQPASAADVPGQRARFLAVGTSNGVVYVWNMRAAVSQNAAVGNKIDPLRIIDTDSPEISSLAMTSLYLVHGGNDGLVQAWDPLASSTQPIRTLNSRFSARARRHLAQAQAAGQGVGNNYFAAGAICLDPDPTQLRGIVALGTHLRYWAFSSSAVEQYKSHKRKLRYTQRGSNSASPESQRYVNSGRGEIHDFILNEQRELEREQAAREKERERLRGRFGVDLLGPDASDEDMLRYAMMLSEEAYTSDEAKRRESECRSSSGSVTESMESAARVSSAVSVLEPVDEEVDADLAEAIRRSLADTSVTARPGDVSPAPCSSHIATATASSSSSSPSPSASASASASASRSSLNQTQVDTDYAESSTRQEETDLEFALQLSLAEQRSLGVEADSAEEHREEFPALGAAEASARTAPRTPPSKGRRSKFKGKEKEVLWG